MSYSYARINLEKTNYRKMKGGWKFSSLASPEEYNKIYYKYCNYHKFNSVMPIFDIEYEENDIIEYYDGFNLVAFSMIGRYDEHNAECYQFAWDYDNPKLHLGIKSLRNECAIYKELGFKYLYIGGADEYKQKINGFEVMGPVNWIEDRWSIDGFEKI